MRQIGYSESGNAVMYDDLWTMQQAREALEQGNVLYVVDPSTGDRSELELHNGRIHLGAADGGDRTLDDLPPCG